MIDLERLKMPILIFVGLIVVLVIMAQMQMIDKRIFFDERGRIKQYALDERGSPIPLKGVVMILAVMITVVMFKREV